MVHESFNEREGEIETDRETSQKERLTLIVLQLVYNIIVYRQIKRSLAVCSVCIDPLRGFLLHLLINIYLHEREREF